VRAALTAVQAIARKARSPALRLVVIAARIKRDGAILVAARGAICAGKIAQRISHVGLRIEQPGGRAGIAHRSRRPEPDLHQTVIAAVHRARIAAALAANDALDQRSR